MKLFDGLKLVFLTDLHLETLPTRTGWEPATAPCLDTALNFCEDFKPDITILGGDIMNFDEISEHTKDKPLLREGRRLKHDFDYGNEVLDRVDKFTKGDKIFQEGNHEIRFARWVERNPSVEGLVSIEQNLKLKERGYKVIKENVIYKVGHARFFHGLYTNKYHSAKTVEVVGDNIFYGHTHSVQVFSKHNYEQNPIIGYNVGSLCELRPFYGRNRPNQWVNAFGVFYFSGSGHFTFYNPIIIRGQFWWNGKLYTPEGRKK